MKKLFLLLLLLLAAGTATAETTLVDVPVKDSGFTSMPQGLAAFGTLPGTQDFTHTFTCEEETGVIRFAIVNGGTSFPEGGCTAYLVDSKRYDDHPMQYSAEEQCFTFDLKAAGMTYEDVYSVAIRGTRYRIPRTDNTGTDERTAQYTLFPSCNVYVDGIYSELDRGACFTSWAVSDGNVWGVEWVYVTRVSDGKQNVVVSFRLYENGISFYEYYAQGIAAPAWVLVGGDEGGITFLTCSPDGTDRDDIESWDYSNGGWGYRTDDGEFTPAEQPSWLDVSKVKPLFDTLGLDRVVSYITTYLTIKSGTVSKEPTRLTDLADTPPAPPVIRCVTSYNAQTGILTAYMENGGVHFQQGRYSMVLEAAEYEVHDMLYNADTGRYWIDLTQYGLTLEDLYKIDVESNRYVYEIYGKKYHITTEGRYTFDTGETYIYDMYVAGEHGDWFLRSGTPASTSYYQYLSRINDGYQNSYAMLDYGNSLYDTGLYRLNGYTLWPTANMLIWTEKNEYVAYWNDTDYYEWDGWSWERYNYEDETTYEDEVPTDVDLSIAAPLGGEPFFSSQAITPQPETAPITIKSSGLTALPLSAADVGAAPALPLTTLQANYDEDAKTLTVLVRDGEADFPAGKHTVTLETKDGTVHQMACTSMGKRFTLDLKDAGLAYEDVTEIRARGTTYQYDCGATTASRTASCVLDPETGRISYYNTHAAAENGDWFIDGYLLDGVWNCSARFVTQVDDGRQDAVVLFSFDSAEALQNYEITRKLTGDYDQVDIRCDQNGVTSIALRGDVLYQWMPSSHWYSITYDEGTPVTTYYPTLSGIDLTTLAPLFGKSPFAGPALMEAILPASLETVEAGAFEDAALQRVVAEEGLRRIESRAFAACADLEEVVLPASVTYIAEDAFAGSNQVTITAPAGSYAATWAESHGIDVKP